MNLLQKTFTKKVPRSIYLQLDVDKCFKNTRIMFMMKLNK